MDLRLMVPNTLDGRFALPQGISAEIYDVTAPVDARLEQADALVVWGNSREWVRSAAQRMTRVRWVQSLGAGAEQVSEAGFGSDVVLTSGAGLHDRPVAEHALALLLAAARRLDLLRDAQLRHEWSDRGGRQPGDDAPEFSTLRGRRVAVWGFGGIGRTLAGYLSMLGADVIGIARSKGRRDGFDVVDDADVDALLPTVDVLVLALPGGDATRRLVGADRLALLRPTAWILNVGRGTVLDEGALIDTLRRGAIAGAALDVFETEPLPADSPLWELPSVIVSPHAAGGRPLGYAALIEHNARALLGEVEWRNRIVRGK
ncbi:phosphoglycerate dehydrogenase [Jiangella aurantiaca]|uniref:Phosphoglycerate dehydrogenase n=1 Tax=Jiangella aurantiaca TaxID=2530373 RepID=A0A4R5ACX6_9ACTN|nr:NAD(P)-dependent oxidoreductase [Jiangella aurantiaca]TDD68929.1 phosphoglycerate dehydrogenase [Jiangella aurantiaca]